MTEIEFLVNVLLTEPISGGLKEKLLKRIEEVEKERVNLKPFIAPIEMPQPIAPYIPHNPIIPNSPNYPWAPWIITSGGVADINTTLNGHITNASSGTAICSNWSTNN